MAENNDFTHLPLPLLFQGKPKLRGGGAVSAPTKRNTANRIAHGSYVKRRSAELSCFWKERRAERSENALPEIKTGIPILLEIDPSADIDFLRGLGFEIVCEIEEGFIIVATEDVDLSVLNEKADAFVANVTARCNSPAKVYALCEDGDRLKRILSKELYAKWATISPTQYMLSILALVAVETLSCQNGPIEKMMKPMNTILFVNNGGRKSLILPIWFGTKSRCSEKKQ